jgi:hypothetical protein
MLYRVHLAWALFEITVLVVIGTDSIGSYKACYVFSDSVESDGDTEANNLLNDEPLMSMYTFVLL